MKNTKPIVKIIPYGAHWTWEVQSSNGKSLMVGNIYSTAKNAKRAFWRIYSLLDNGFAWKEDNEIKCYYESREVYY